MSQNAFGRSNQESQIRVPKHQNQTQQYNPESQYPVRTSNTTYEYRSNQTRVAPVRTSAYTTQNLNRQSAGNTAVKNQIQSRAQYHQGANTNTNSMNQSQTRSSQIGRTYVYQPASRREYITNESYTRGHRGVSMETGDAYQNTRLTYEIPGRVQQPLATRGLNERYRNNIYVSGSGSPGFRRYVRNMEDESTYKSYIRGGIVKLRKWKYTTQTEINKIILIQRYWRYVHLRRIERRQTLLSQSSEQRSENENQIEIENESSNSERYNENERYANYANYANDNIYRTETKIRKNAREKIISGTKNRYIVETTTIEVFKNQNTVLKKVAPEILEKETKKIKRKGIKEQMIEIWNNEIIPTYTDSINIIAENDVNQYTQIIEEYEEQFKQIKTKMTQYEEEIVELTNKLNTYEKRNWNKLVQERKEIKINIKHKEKKFIEIVEILMKLRKPLQYRREKEIKIISQFKAPKKILSVEERDSINIKGEQKQENQVEYIDEMFLSEEIKPENEIQIVDQMEILKTEQEKEKEQHQWITIPSEEQKITILKKPKSDNILEERDSLLILGIEKEQNQVEYIDELFLEELSKPDNEIQIVDQMEILKIKEPKPENEIEYIDSIECTYEIRGWITQISEEDKLTILGQEKPVKPENAIEERDSLLIPGMNYS